MKIKNEIKAFVLAMIILVSILFSSLPLVSAAYTIEYHRMTPDLTGDVNCDGTVDIKDEVRVIGAYGSYPGRPKWDSQADLNEDRKVDIKDLVIVIKNFGNYESPLTPIAYSTTFDFAVPAYAGGDVGKEVWYYILARLYVPSELSGQNFYFVATADDRVQNVKMDGCSKAGSGSSVNIDLGTLGGGYHLLEFEFVDVSGGGSLNFHVTTAASQYAWLSRFRIYVPNYSDTKYEYTVKTHAYFPPTDYYYLGGYADDYISDVYLGVGCIYHDWEWNSQNGAGNIFRWDFMYPLETLSGWNDVNSTYGNKKDGVLDFQYLSRTLQQDRIGNPKFWTKIYPPSSSALTLYDGIAFAGSKWDSIPGSRQRFTAGIRVLANATDTNTYYPIPQEAEVSLFLDVPGPPWNKNSYQDIGVYINLTYTYYIEESLTYGMPIWFEPYLISVNMPTQGYMLYMPTPSIIYSTQSEKSFVSPEWKVVVATSYIVLSGLLSFLYTPVGAALIQSLTYPTIYSYLQDQQLNSTQEYYGPPTSRNYTMNAFKTTQDQIPLSPVVSSVCSAYFFRVWAFSPTYAGGVTVDLHGRLWLPFFYKNPPPGSPSWYGTWLPIEIEICTVFPVFITD